jgi:hypothetical protein
MRLATVCVCSVWIAACGAGDGVEPRPSGPVDPEPVADRQGVSEAQEVPAESGAQDGGPDSAADAGVAATVDAGPEAPVVVIEKLPGYKKRGTRVLKKGVRVRFEQVPGKFQGLPG